MTEEQIEKAAYQVCASKSILVTSEDLAAAKARILDHLIIEAAIAGVCEPTQVEKDRRSGKRLDIDPAWLMRMAEAEDKGGTSVGGLACDLGLYVKPPDLAALGVNVNMHDDGIVDYTYGGAHVIAEIDEDGDIAFGRTLPLAHVRVILDDAERRAKTKKAPGTPD